MRTAPTRIALAAALAASPALAQVPYLVADVNTRGVGSFPGEIVAFAGQAYFSADRDGLRQLWRSDGTPAGTVLVKDVEQPEELTVAGGRLFFTAQGPAGAELWVSDGSGAGTVAIASGLFLWVRELTAVGGTIFFIANSRELWRSDGTTAGTVLVADLCGGSCSEAPHGLAAVGSRLFLVADDGVTGSEPWTSDGSPGGTVRVADVCPGNCSSQPAELIAVAGEAFFTADDGSSGRELWKIDAALAAGRVADICSGGCASDPLDLTPFAGALYFAATDALGDRGLWRSDGSGPGTLPVEALDQPEQLTAVGSTLFLRASFAADLWRTDGAPGAAVLVRSAISPDRLTAVGNTLYFVTDRAGPAIGDELWTSDGSPAGTTLLRDICPGSCTSDPAALADVSGQAFFAADDGSAGPELWHSDGTGAGTSMLRINQQTFGSSPEQKREVNGKVAFLARTGQRTTPWISDGTPAGTVALVAEESDQLVELDGTLFFVVNGSELWSSDGTPAGSQRVTDLGATIQDLTPAGHRLYFTASGFELWTTDGTAPGTVPLATLPLPPTSLTASGGRLFFQVLGPSTLWELWSSAGQAGDTTMLRSFCPPCDCPPCVGRAELIDLGMSVAFFAEDGAGGVGLWRSDSGSGLTTLVTSVCPGACTGNPLWLGAAGGRACFSHDDGGGRGREPWLSDGTGAGTVLLADLCAGACSSDPGTAAEVDGNLWFFARDASGCSGLWTSDATGGVARIPGFCPDQCGQDAILDLGGIAYFGVSEPAGGCELWQSDGTAPGTSRVGDVAPGPPGSAPADLMQAGGKLYFSADDGVHGRELWALDSGLATTVLLRSLSLTQIAPPLPPLAQVLPLVPGRDRYRSSFVTGSLEPDAAIVGDSAHPLVFYAADGVAEIRLTKTASQRIRFSF